VAQNRYEARRFLTRRDFGFSLLKQLIADFDRLSHYPTIQPGRNPPPAPSIPTEGVASVTPTMPVSPATPEYREFVRKEVERVRPLCEHEEAAKQSDDQDNKPTWADFHILKKLLLPMYPRDELYSIVLALREDFESIAPERTRTAYEATVPKVIDQNESYQKLLAHAQFLQEQISGIETYRATQELSATLSLMRCSYRSSSP
jgi:hypothetical protein